MRFPCGNRAFETEKWIFHVEIAFSETGKWYFRVENAFFETGKWYFHVEIAFFETGTGFFHAEIAFCLLHKKERKVCQKAHLLCLAQSPDFHKLGLCYYLKILYL